MENQIQFQKQTACVISATLTDWITEGKPKGTYESMDQAPWQDYEEDKL